MDLDFIDENLRLFSMFRKYVEVTVLNKAAVLF